MNHFEQILLSLTVCISLLAIGAEQSQQPPKLPTFGQMVEQQPEWRTYAKLTNLPQDKSHLQTKLLQMPPEIRNMTYRYMMYPNINKITDSIIVLADATNIDMLLDFLKSLPYTANGVDMIERLQAANVSAAKNPRISNWYATAKNRLVFGKELYDAIGRNNLESVRELLKNKDIDLNYRWIDVSWGLPRPRRTPLIRASQMYYSNATQMAQLLINAGANVDAQDFFGGTALKDAAFGRKTEIVRSLLNAGADPDIQAQYGLIAYLNAPAEKKSEIFGEYMMGNRERDMNWTALMQAAFVGDIEIVKLLLNAGANPTLIDRKSKSARDYALDYYHHNQAKDTAALVKILDEATRKWEATHE